MLNCDGRHLVNCRMYREFIEVWEGFSKNARPAFENRLGQFVMVGLVLLVALVLPFLWVILREQRWLVSLQLQPRFTGSGRHGATRSATISRSNRSGLNLPLGP